ncbi:hypothetical protein PHET_12281 [Paragonimus heterotremus]|uniref:Uncharacterized protein n=1 Tax=Paragonimus heterotremus TaxID=100268 RepID=A0A8J4SPH5_9TREM|nr:hypothetical protein PHET_12281 [Paragonimus heterotremus]
MFPSSVSRRKKVERELFDTLHTINPGEFICKAITCSVLRTNQVASFFCRFLRDFGVHSISHLEIMCFALRWTMEKFEGRYDLS